jgi:23S rRNA pseudouridine2604 synthase
MNINELLVAKLSISKEAAIQLIADKRVFIDSRAATQKEKIDKRKLIQVEDKVLQSPFISRSLAFYKPRGIECTLNPKVKKNLKELLPFTEHLFPVGRLDKDSEGLLLLTNDGDVYNKIALAKAFQEKEYLVEVNKVLAPEHLKIMASGMRIMGKQTRAAIVNQINPKLFRIILTEGINRQIRRMTYQLGYQVECLKRTRIMSIELDNLKPFEYREVDFSDLFKEDINS